MKPGSKMGRDAILSIENGKEHRKRGKQRKKRIEGDLFGITLL